MRTINIITTIIAVTLAASSCNKQKEYIAVTGHAQGGIYKVTLSLDGVRTKPETIRKDIDSILTLIDTTLSGYNKKSILSRFNAGDTVVANKMFIDLYNSAAAFYEETDAALDVASAPLFDIWGFGFTSDSLPSSDKIAKALASCGMKRLAFPMESRISNDGTICGKVLLKDELKDSETLPELNYNAIAQGYSCDAVASYLYSIGVKDMLVDIGEIYCDGVNPSGKPWSIGVDKPIDGNNTPGAALQGIWTSGGNACGIVTSGNYRKFYVKDGKKYSHTIDPRTGEPVNDSLLSATIVAKDGMTADAYATYCMVIGFEQAKQFISQRDDIEGYLIYSSGEAMSTWASKGFTLKDIEVSEDQ